MLHDGTSHSSHVSLRSLSLGTRRRQQQDSVKDANDPERITKLLEAKSNQHWLWLDFENVGYSRRYAKAMAAQNDSTMKAVALMGTVIALSLSVMASSSPAGNIYAEAGGESDRTPMRNESTQTAVSYSANGLLFFGVYHAHYHNPASGRSSTSMMAMEIQPMPAIADSTIVASLFFLTAICFASSHLILSGRVHIFTLSSEAHRTVITQQVLCNVSLYRPPHPSSCLCLGCYRKCSRLFFPSPGSLLGRLGVVSSVFDPFGCRPTGPLPLLNCAPPVLPHALDPRGYNSPSPEPSQHTALVFKARRGIRASQHARQHLVCCSTGMWRPRGFHPCFCAREK